MAQFEQEAEDLMKLEQFMISTANRIESTVKEKKLCIEKQNQLKFECRDLKNKLYNQQHDKTIFQDKLYGVESKLEELNQQIALNENKTIKLEAEKKKFAATRKFKEASLAQGQLKSLVEMTKSLKEQIVEMKVE